uniref:Uncharacterized protein n=1 Tax=Paenibacillus athensensis TaxID=1967502 RepID=A0A4Y8PVE5_9BACL
MAVTPPAIFASAQNRHSLLAAATPRCQAVRHPCCKRLWRAFFIRAAAPAKVEICGDAYSRKSGASRIRSGLQVFLPTCPRSELYFSPISYSFAFSRAFSGKTLGFIHQYATTVTLTFGFCGCSYCRIIFFMLF